MHSWEDQHVRDYHTHTARGRHRESRKHRVLIKLGPLLRVAVQIYSTSLLCVSARGLRRWLSPSVLGSELVWTCMWAHACLWKTDLVSRSDNVRSCKSSLSWLTTSSSCSTEENMSFSEGNKPIFSIWQPTWRIYRASLSMSLCDYSWENVSIVKLSMVAKSWSTTSVYWSEPSSRTCQFVIWLDN